MKKIILSAIALTLAVLANAQNQSNCFIGKTGESVTIVQFLDTRTVQITKVTPTTTKTANKSYCDFDGYISIDSDTYARRIQKDGSEALELVHKGRVITLKENNVKKSKRR